MPTPYLTPEEISSLTVPEIETYEPRQGFATMHLNDNNRPLIKRWLVLMGMNERKVLTASDFVLANAYRAGKPYIDKVNAEGTERRFGGGGRGSRSIPLELDPEKDARDAEAKRLLESVLDNDGSELLSRPAASTVTATVSSPALPQVRLDEAAIARAAAAVIAPRLQEAKRDLMKLAADEIEKAAQAFYLSDRTKTEITDLAVESANERIADFADNTKAFIEQLHSEHRQLVDQLSAQIPRKIEVIQQGKPTRVLEAEPRHKSFDEILFWLSMGKHVYMVGPRGTGKTHLFEQIAEALDLKNRFFPIGQTLTKYELSGHKGPTGEYVGTLLRDAIEHGGFVAIDEGDTWAAQAMVFLNTPLANKYCPFPDKVVPVHPDFRCAIAANTYGTGATRQYQGRNPLDAASLDRFAFVEVSYDEDLERQLYGNGPWVQYCHRVRKAAEQLHQYELVPSMRGIDMCVSAAAANGSPDMIASGVLWKGAGEDTITKIKNIAGDIPRLLTRVA